MAPVISLVRRLTRIAFGPSPLGVIGRRLASTRPSTMADERGFLSLALRGAELPVALGGIVPDPKRCRWMGLGWLETSGGLSPWCVGIAGLALPTRRLLAPWLRRGDGRAANARAVVCDIHVVYSKQGIGLRGEENNAVNAVRYTSRRN